MSEGTGQPPAGWYPDGRGAQRWWDGSGWTEHTGGSPGGPPPGAPAAPPPPPPRPQPPVQSPPGPPGPPPSQPPPGQSFGWQRPGAPGPSGGYAPAGPPPGPPQKSRKGLLIGGVVAAVLLVVGLGVVLALTLGGSDPSDDTASPGGDDSSTGSADDPDESTGTDEPSQPSESGGTGGSDAGGSDDPAATAVEYLEAQLAVDLVRLCELSSEEKREIYEAGSSDGTCAGVADGGEDSPTVPGDDTFSFVTEVTEQDEDSATVEYELDVTADATPGESLDDPFGRLSMVREDDQWRVDDEEFFR